MGRPVIYAVGRAIVDLYAEETGVPLPEAASFRRYAGGSSANTAVGLARLGVEVGLIARVGTDPMGQFLHQQLRSEGVDTAMLAQDAERPTGMAFAALFPPDDSEVWFCPRPNANANLCPQDLDPEQIRAARALVIAGTALASETSRQTVALLLDIARQDHIRVVFDVDWRPMFWERPDEAPAVYGDALAHADVVLANEPELALVGGTSDMTVAAHRVLALGAAEVVAKRGAGGSWFFDGRDAIHVPAYEVAVVNTLGAGDGFAAGYVYGLQMGWEAHQRLEFASATGAIVVSRHSCSDAMPRRVEVQEFLRASTRRVP